MLRLLQAELVDNQFCLVFGLLLGVVPHIADHLVVAALVLLSDLADASTILTAFRHLLRVESHPLGKRVLRVTALGRA